jgi:hypothetical protein
MTQDIGLSYHGTIGVRLAFATPSSDKIYQGNGVIPYVQGISEIFRNTGNHFNIRTIFKTNPTLRGPLKENGPVRDIQYTQQCV